MNDSKILILKGDIRLFDNIKNLILDVATVVTVIALVKASDGGGDAIELTPITWIDRAATER